MKHILSVGSALFGLGILSAWAEPVLPNPITWWKMDAIEDGKVADASGNGRDLTVGAGCVLTNEAMSGKGVFWDGTTQAWGRFSYPALRSQTLSIWFRRDLKDGSLGKSVNTWPYLFAINSYKVHFNFDENNKDSAATVYLPDGKTVSGFEVFRNTWSHLVLVIEERSFAEGKCTFACRGYLNGALVASDDTGRSFTPFSLANAILGNNAQGGSRPVHGIMDDVRIYDQALTRSQVEELYNEGCCPRDEIRVVGKWDLNDVRQGEGGARTIPEQTGRSAAISIESEVGFTNGVDIGSQAFWFPGTTTSLAKSSVLYPFNLRDVTFSAWFYQSPDSATPPTEGNVFNRVCAVAGLFEIQISNNNGTSCIHYGPSGASQTINNFYGGYGAWTHFVICYKTWYDDATGKYVARPVFYRNGELVCTGNVDRVSTCPALKKGTTLWFGSKGDRNRTLFGAFDMPRLYAGCLTPEQIRSLYRGAAKPDAGEDFSVAASRACLQGRVADTANPSGGVRHGYAGRSRWSFVSGPEGSDAVEILNPEAEITDVIMPVEGDYTFRLSVTTEEGEVRQDDVVVSRVAPVGLATPSVSIAAAAGKAAPESVTLTATASDPAGKPLRLIWRRESGPGTVRFSSPGASVTEASFSLPGSYVLSCTAENGETSASATVTVSVSSATISAPDFLKQGLIGHWGFDCAAPYADAVSGSSGSFQPGPRQCRPEAGVSGNGIASRFDIASRFKTNVSLQEDGDTGSVPTSRWRTFSLWMYHDPSEDVSLTKESSLIFVGYTLGIRYNCENGGDGFTLYQQGVGGGSAKMRFARPSVDPKGRWTHVVAVIDRSSAPENNESQLWVDGVLQKATNGTLRAARKRTESIEIGGMNKSATNDEGNGSYIIGGVTYSRRFPGVIDEVRLYNRALSEPEIKWLATHPQVDAVMGPVIDGLPKTVKALKKKEQISLSPVVSGTEGSDATYKWEVVAGDAAGLQIQGADKATCTIVGGVAGTYRVRLRVTGEGRTTYSDLITVVITPGGLVFMVR